MIKSVLAVTALTMLIAGAGVVMAPQYQPPERVYAFTLPLVMLGCFEYPLQPNETFGNWRLIQPTVIYVRKDIGPVTIRDLMFEDSAFCMWREL